MPTKIPPPSLPDKGKTITFHRFPHHIWHDQNLSLHERVILCRVWSFENSTPPLACYLSFEQWARELGCKRRHTIKVLNLLIEKKLLSKIGRGTQTNLWALVHTEHQQEDASAYRTLPSAYRTPVLVHTEHQTSVYSAPKKIKEDQLEDHKEDQVVADAPTPTYDLVTHGDYPCHLRGLPSETLAESATPPGIESIPPWTESPDPLDTESTYKNIYKINHKIRDKSAVADAPSPSLSEPHRFVVSELTSEQRATLLALLDGPARLAGHDPEKVLDGLLADCQRYSNGGNDKKRFRACWFETLKRQFVGKKIKDWAARPAKPLGASGLTYQQQQTCFRDFWNEAHGLDRPDLSWLTKEQKAFLQKLMGRLCETEAAYVGDLAKKRSDEFGYQCRDFTNAIKELEQELAK